VRIEVVSRAQTGDDWEILAESDEEVVRTEEDNP
jgi:hypothetical protein